ncbi:DNA polymerase III subunit epsilon [Roseococcus sp. DSY-14]|uniref:DNA polymerase III subunit epsilon n=1 Tax=Roseococcus sp. DSY-14 TaxID=3369650 RepID=UPI00387B2951
MREVVLDTETTGFDPLTGDRVIEVAAIELVNLLPTGRHFHALVDPERDVPPESTRVHGFTRADLEGKPKFRDIAAAMLDFLADSPIVAHNAPFDFGFLDAELLRAGRPALDRARMVDSLVLAKARFPGAPNSLDALCRRFGIDLSERTTHNALLDVKLLAAAYLELRGGRQSGLSFEEAPAVALLATEARAPRTPRPILLSAEQEAAHRAFVEKAIKDALWLR